MNPLYIYTLFDLRTNKPRCAGYKDNGRVVVLDLFRGKGSGIPIVNIFNRIDKFRRLITTAERTRPIVLSNYKRHIQAYGLEKSHRLLDIYDLDIPEIASTESIQRDVEIVTKVLNKMDKYKLYEYQKIHANASVAYSDLEERGIDIGHCRHYPKWSTNTFSGRSKSTGVSIQGWSDGDCIRPPGFNERDVLIHFDWICADIRVASLLSKDKRLKEAFAENDPYDKMMQIINDGPDSLTRNECKVFLLKSINSMDLNSVALTDVYPKLGQWISKCKKKARCENGHLETILGKKFKIINAKNELAVLNGVMQGSVAHAMQCAFRRVWDKFPSRIVSENHDSVVVCSGPSKSEIKSVINIVSDIMLNPFRGVLESDPAFPVKISVGKKWKQWSTVMIKRESGVEYVKKKHERKNSTKSEIETAET